MFGLKWYEWLFGDALLNGAGHPFKLIWSAIKILFVILIIIWFVGFVREHFLISSSERKEDISNIEHQLKVQQDHRKCYQDINCNINEFDKKQATDYYQNHPSR